jgi:hypothetical protein
LFQMNSLVNIDVRTVEMNVINTQHQQTHHEN